MKTIKLISVILVLAAFCSILVGCNQVDPDKIELPDRPFYDINVSFEIKKSDGAIIGEPAVNYNYKGHEEPTIFNILSDYVVIELDYRFATDKNGTLSTIGGIKASSSKGEYWAILRGTGHDVKTLLADKDAKKKALIDANMADYDVRIYKCGNDSCIFEYDSNEGHGSTIEAGTRWEELPEDFVCPRCGGAKENFKLETIEFTIVLTKID